MVVCGWWLHAIFVSLRVEMSYSTGHHGFVAVVGESSYQDTLRTLPTIFTAMLVPQPDNPYDRNAVAVITTDGRIVGYLARDVAKSYHARLVRHSDSVTCPAKLIGGGAKSIGVVLDFEAVRRGLGLPSVAVDHGDMDSDAVAEYHRLNHQSRQIVAQTKPLEKTDVPGAEAAYRRGIALIIECHGLATDRGLLTYGFLPNQTDTEVLERLVVCLLKQGRAEDPACA